MKIAYTHVKDPLLQGTVIQGCRARPRLRHADVDAYALLALPLMGVYPEYGIAREIAQEEGFLLRRGVRLALRELEAERRTVQQGLRACNRERERARLEPPRVCLADAVRERLDGREDLGVSDGLDVRGNRGVVHRVREVIGRRRAAHVVGDAACHHDGLRVGRA